MKYRKRFKFLTLGIFLMLHLVSVSQNSRLDSLLTVLKTMKEDTLRSNTLNELTRIYLFELQDLEKGHANAVQQIALAKKINFKKGLANGYLNNGIYYRTTGNYGMAHYFDNAALKIVQSIGNKKGNT